MKIGKILSLLIVSVMIFSILAACSGNIEKPVDAVTDGVTTDGGNTDTPDTSVNVILKSAGVFLRTLGYKVYMLNFVYN